MKTSPLVIGITGGIGGGKSFVRQCLENLGCFGIDADLTARQVLACGEIAVQKAVSTFGKSILMNGDEANSAMWEVDRCALAQIVFADKSALRKLENITHPETLRRIRAEILAVSSPIALEAIGLFQSGLAELCTETWLVNCPQEIRVERLMKNRRFSQEEALHRVESQSDIDFFGFPVTRCFDSSGNAQDLMLQVQSAWELAKARVNLFS